MFLKNYFSNNGLTSHQIASRRITLFTVIMCLISLMGVMGWFPNNALQLMHPLYSTIMWCALVCLLICFFGLFDGTKVPGEKEFGNWSWFGLIFSCGMGVGLLNYAFQECAMLYEYGDSPDPLGQVFNHWTLVVWGLYGAFTIFEAYDQKYDLSPNWFKELKAYLYSISMMLGIGISFALGVIAVSGAFEYIYGIHIPSYALVILLGVLVAVSVFRGMHKGLKVFSNVTMGVFYLYILILMFHLHGNFIPMMLTGLESFVTDFGYNNIFHGSQLQIDWTVYYWIWFAGWIPFVAPWVIKISQGRSIRAIVTALVLLPAILIILFMGIGSNIGMELYYSGVDTKVLQFEAIKQTWYLPILFVFLMIAFYVTSSDSQSVALDSMISKGSKTKLVYRKMLWIMMEMVFVTILLLSGDNTINAFLGLSLLFVPLIFIIGGYYCFLISKLKVKELTKSKLNE